MTSKNTLIIGTRGSALALAQADMVRAALSALHPGLDIRREIIRTTGDRRTDVPLADVARVSGIVDKGIFIKELETALLEGRIDVAVHSLKDVPSELAPEFRLPAVLPRAAAEDVLITKEPDWNGRGTLATGSVRRRGSTLNAGGDGVLTAVRKDKLEFVGLFDHDGRCVKAGDAGVIERESHFHRLVAGVDDYLPVVERTADGIFPSGGNGHDAAVYRHAAAREGCAVAGELYFRGRVLRHGGTAAVAAAAEQRGAEYRDKQEREI